MISQESLQFDRAFLAWGFRPTASYTLAVVDSHLAALQEISRLRTAVQTMLDAVDADDVDRAIAVLLDLRDAP